MVLQVQYPGLARSPLRHKGGISLGPIFGHGLVVTF